MATLAQDRLQQQQSLKRAHAEAIRILIVDDHTMVRTGLRMLLESQPGFSVVGEAAAPPEALAVAALHHPDIILLDLVLGDTSALDFLPDLLHAAPSSQVLVMTGLHDPEVHRRAVLLGAMGLVHKEEASDVLLQAIAKVHAGEVWLDPALVARVLAVVNRNHTEQPSASEVGKVDRLSAREREVVALVGQGLKNRRIADRLCIAEATVRHHLTSIFAKLGVVDRLELVIYAYRHGLSRFPP